MTAWSQDDLAARLLFAAGVAHVKQAGDAVPTEALVGTLYFSPSGYLLLSVPNALVRGVFAALHEPGAELPVSSSIGKLNSHITVCRPEELAAIGGAGKVSERGKMFRFGLSDLVTCKPDGWKDMEAVWFLKVRSKALERLRASYGLSCLPNGGKHQFHVTCAVRRSGVLRAGDAVVKGGEPAARGPAVRQNESFSAKV